MPFIITDPCIETKDTACVDVCPVDCIHPRKDEPEFAASTMLYIHPEECIDCGACVPACPVAAIYESVDSTPSNQRSLVEAGQDPERRQVVSAGAGGRGRDGDRQDGRGMGAVLHAGQLPSLHPVLSIILSFPNRALFV